jgi:hypothetical protein
LNHKINALNDYARGIENPIAKAISLWVKRGFMVCDIRMSQKTVTDTFDRKQVLLLGFGHLCFIFPAPGGGGT